MSDLTDIILRRQRQRLAEYILGLHELDEPGDVCVEGVRCDTEWCTAFSDERAECGDRSGPYAGLAHRNRLDRVDKETT